jgi:hypothetical protein
MSRVLQLADLGAVQERPSTQATFGGLARGEIAALLARESEKVGIGHA